MCTCGDGGETGSGEGCDNTIMDNTDCFADVARGLAGPDPACPRPSGLVESFNREPPSAILAPSSITHKSSPQLNIRHKEVNPSGVDTGKDTQCLVEEDDSEC